ncbi:MAG: preprotein translocase subunit SecG [Lachnospiraceae bacterium]|nr:preprotein translocase subunit SecG [Lachnospiraceae bacterium]
MEALKVILTIVYVLICVGLIVVVLMQEGKEGLSSGIMGGSSDTYWSKNRGRSREGKLSKSTIILAALFVVLSVLLNVWVLK